MEILNELLNKQEEFKKNLEAFNRKLDELAQRKVSVNLDHQAITDKIKAGLPSIRQFEAVNQEIKKTISAIPTKITIEAPDEVLGFTNLKSLLINWAIFLSLLVLVWGGVTYTKNQEIEALEQYRRNSSDFVNWIQKEYPKAWEKWKKE